MSRAILWAIAALLALIVAWVTFAVSEPPMPARVTLATGGERGAYFKYGRELAGLVGALGGPEVRVVPSAGSVENLRLLVEGQADVAFVQGGIAQALAGSMDLGSVRVIAKVYSEPLWVFYRGDSELRFLRDIKAATGAQKRRIAVGGEGSGTRPIAVDLLRVNGIGPRDAVFLELETPAAIEALRRGEIDVLFLVASPEASTVQELLRMPDARLMSFERHRAYAKRLPYLTAVEVEEGLLAIEENLPGRTVSLLAPAATLVTREEVHPRVVELVVKASTRLFGQGNLIDLAGEYPSARGLELPQHAAAARIMSEGESWLTRKLPYWAVELVFRSKLLLIPILTVLLPAFKVIPAVLDWRMRRIIRKHYEALRDVEARARRARARGELEEAVSELEALGATVEEAAGRHPGDYQAQLYHWRTAHELALTRARRRLASFGEAGGEGDSAGRRGDAGDAAGNGDEGGEGAGRGAAPTA